MTARKYRVEQLSRFVERVFVHCGVPEGDARVAGEVLLSADLRGIDSHGIARLKTYYEMLNTRETNPDPKIRVVRESGSTATLDGDNGLGLVVGPRANQLAMEKAARAGTGWVAVNNSNHYGIAGYYAMQAVQKDMIGWAMTNATASVAPLWGMEMMLGTNPLAIAFPGEQEPPIVIDLATSVVTMGAMDLAIARGASIPAGWAIDAQGRATTRPEVLREGGALLPLGGDREHGGHKGYCLAAMVDILSSMLSGANWGPFVPSFGLPRSHRDPPVGKGIGHFLGAMRIDAFIDPSEFKQQIDAWVRTMRATQAAPGTEGPLIPGDPERRSEALRRAEGIPLAESVVESLLEVAGATSIAIV